MEVCAIFPLKLYPPPPTNLAIIKFVVSNAFEDTVPLVVLVIPFPYNVCVVPDLVETKKFHWPSVKVKYLPNGEPPSKTPPPQLFAEVPFPNQKPPT